MASRVGSELEETGKHSDAGMWSGRTSGLPARTTAGFHLKGYEMTGMRAQNSAMASLKL